MNAPAPLPFEAIQTGSDSTSLIDEALTAVREFMGMPVAYLSRFEGDRLVFRNVSAPGLEDLVKPGDEMDLSAAYCPSILSGDLPNLICDTYAIPACRAKAITDTVPIRSHVSLPVHRADGTPYGMFCCLSPVPNPSLNNRDLAVMSTFASLVTRELQALEAAENALLEKRERIEATLARNLFKSVYQPLVEVDGLRVVGVEALTRFELPDGGTPDRWFHDAVSVGLDIELELATLASALDGARGIPDDIYLSLNTSPKIITDHRLADLLSAHTARSIVLEVTEHSEALDTDNFASRISELQQRGIQIALDDVGAGYSGLQRLSRLSPNILKVDRAIADGIDQSATKRAIVTALVQFARETGASVLVEGIEREAEAATLRQLGVKLAQGWLFGRPVPIEKIDFGQPARRLPLH